MSNWSHSLGIGKRLANDKHFKVS